MYIILSFLVFEAVVSGISIMSRLDGKTMKISLLFPKVQQLKVCKTQENKEYFPICLAISQN